MAYIKNTAFEPRVTNRTDDDTLNISGKFYGADGNPDTCSAGFLCVKDTLLPNEGYSNVGPANSKVTLNAGNSWKMKVTGATVKSVGTGIYACNNYGVNEIQDPITGQVFRVGANTLGIPLPADVLGTFTYITFDGKSIYRFGVANVNAAVGANKAFTIVSGLLKPETTAPTVVGQPYFQLLGSGTFTEGLEGAFGYIDVLATTVTETA